jgi:hypothetical protein
MRDPNAAVEFGTTRTDRHLRGGSCDSETQLAEATSA